VNYDTGIIEPNDENGQTPLIKNGCLLVVLSNILVVLLKLIKKNWAPNLIAWALDYCF
jgi:hypothetical protein